MTPSFVMHLKLKIEVYRKDIDPFLLGNQFAPLIYDISSLLFDRKSEIVNNTSLVTSK